MKEEGKQPNSNGSSWKKLVRKKWFYPAVYLIFAALILTAVIWYQNKAIDLPEDTLTDNTQEQVDTTDNESVPVVTQEEALKMPVSSAADAEIVTKFFDYDASQEDREQALILYNNKYYQSVGVDIASANDEAFDVTAALSGKVTEVKEDPLQGMVVEVTHDDGVTTKYASIEGVTVASGDQVKQGDVLGTAGRNLFGQANGVHVHFELRKDGVALNPEDFFNKALSDIDKPAKKEEGKEDEAKEEQSSMEDDDAASEAEHDQLSRDEDGSDDGVGEDEGNADEVNPDDSSNESGAESSASSASA